MKLVAATPAGALLVPLFAETGKGTLAADVECAAGALGKLPQNIIYTKESPGVWKGKDGSHIPAVEVKKAGDVLTVTLQNKHPMSEAHYIVRHTVVAECGTVLGAKTFSWKDQPASTHIIAHAMNGALGNLGETVVVTEPVEASPGDGIASISAQYGCMGWPAETAVCGIVMVVMLSPRCGVQQLRQ